MKPNEKSFIKSFGNKANSNSNKTEEIIEKKEAKNLPIDLKKVTKQELIEITFTLQR